MTWNRAFWSAFAAVIALAPLAVAHEWARNTATACAVITLVTIAALVVPGGLVAMLVARPLKLAPPRPRTALLFAIAGVVSGLVAAIVWAHHPLQEVSWPVTRATYRSLGDSSFILFPIFLFTGILDIVIMLAVGIALALAPSLVPAFGALLGVLAVTIILAIVSGISRLLARRAERAISDL